MDIVYNNKKYLIEVVRKNNKNTYIRIKDGKVVITTNYFVTSKYINKLIEDNYSSIIKMIDREEDRNKDKDKFILFGKYYDIAYDDNIKGIEVAGSIIYVRNDKVFNRWLSEYVMSVFSNHLFYWYDLFEERIPKPSLKIRSMKTRWGVCNTRSYNITLNRELYRKEIECLDYVCIHELAHLVEANHSKAFWSLVEKYCPNYKEIRKRLRG